MMVGINDPWVALAYLLSFVGSVACVMYGVINWNKGDEPIGPEDTNWAKEEKEEIEAAL
ncbi:MAG: hypothetical protein PHU80_04475 [Kiritimatiellae bacterium]|nr:hypothetical protein [Kiritimatiellia bacterium]